MIYINSLKIIYSGKDYPIDENDCFNSIKLCIVLQIQ